MTKTVEEWTDEIIEAFYPDNSTLRADVQRIVEAMRAELMSTIRAEAEYRRSDEGEKEGVS